MPPRKTRPSVLHEAAPTYSTKPLSQVLWLAYQSLGDEDKTAFLQLLLSDPETFEDLADSIAIIEARDEPSRPYSEFREELVREGLL